MKLKTRLFIAFAAILIIPIMLMTMVMLTVGNRQFKALERYAQKYQTYQEQNELGVDEEQITEAPAQDGAEQSLLLQSGYGDEDVLADELTDGSSGIVPELRSFLYDMAAIIRSLKAI